MEDEERAVLHAITNILDDARAAVWRAFEEQGLDAAYFDVEIDLRVVVDDVTIRVREKEESINTIRNREQEECMRCRECASCTVT
jgi:hypothetical protein